MPRKPYGRIAPTMTARPLPLERSLAHLSPRVAAEFHPTRNGDLSAEALTNSSNKKVWWRCAQGHEWEAAVNNRTKPNKPTGCPYCSGRFPIPGVNDLASQRPDIAEQWHPTKNGAITPEQSTAVSGIKRWWVCEQGHQWQATVASRTSGNTGCPSCSGRKPVPGVNDLATTHPDVAAQWHPTKNGKVTPQEVSAGSDFEAWWTCDRHAGAEWQNKVHSQVISKHGCPQCAIESRVALRRVPKAGRSLAEVRPDLAPQWNPELNGGRQAHEVAAQANGKFWWTCQSGHTYQQYISGRTTRDYGCPQCNAGRATSKPEGEIQQVLESLGLDVVRNAKGLMTSHPQREIDVYVPSKKFAVEYHGLFWHSEGRIPRKYHAEKTQLCAAEGIRLFQVWEDDWRDRREIVIRGLAHRLGVTENLPAVLPELPEYYSQRIGARQCKIVQVHKHDAKDFLLKNHIQGAVPGSVYLGLVDRENRLRALLVLRWKSADFTSVAYLDRYATAGSVAGGFTRLLKYAVRAYSIREVITFADLSLSDGGLYESNGFTLDSILAPDYMYVVDKRRVHKFNYRLKRFREDESLIYVDGLSEAQLAALNGLMRVWDSGKARWVWRSSQ